jgi:hypothetical protein
VGATVLDNLAHNLVRGPVELDHVEPAPPDLEEMAAMVQLAAD